MLFKKMLAVLSAIAVIGTCSAYNGSTFNVSAENTSVSDAEAETCSLTVSVSPLADPVPEGSHIKARLVKMGEEDIAIDEWELTQDGVKELKGIEYSEDTVYKIIISDLPEGYELPKSTTVRFDRKGDTDTIIFCGRGAERAEREENGNFDCIELTAPIYSHIDGWTFILPYHDGGIREKCAVDENGARYCGVGGMYLPDGHYTAYAVIGENSRFVRPDSEAAASITYFEGSFDERINMEYFDRDFTKGIEFDVADGKTDTLLYFYCESIPGRDSCSADISVVDSETGEPVDGIKLTITNKSIIKKDHITWNSSDANPRVFDKLQELKTSYIVTPLNTSELYYIPETSFSFSTPGVHRDIVIKAVRKKNTELSKIELPDEAPEPTDEQHCAVTVGVMDTDRKPVTGVTASIYKISDGKKTVLLNWNAEEEPVKTINDIEYEENAEYYFAVSGGKTDYIKSSDMQLGLSKGGIADKAVHVIHQKDIPNIDCECTIHSINSGVKITNSKGPLGITVTDKQGYRYSCVKSSIYLPDGEYLLKPYLGTQNRIIGPNTEMDSILSRFEPSLKGSFAQNADNYNNGINFTVTNGESNKKLAFYAEEVPTSANSCSADIKVVYDETEENAEGVTVAMYSPYNPGNISWNTTETPVMSFDFLRYLNTDYSFELEDIPSGFIYSKEDQKISFSKYGEHKELVIKLIKADQKGDANCDGSINMADAVLIMQYIANPDKYGTNGTSEHHITAQGMENADIAGNNDGVTNSDALTIQKKLLKLD